MARAIDSYSDVELQNLIDNHRRQQATDRPLYAEAVNEQHRRHGGGLNLNVSLAHLRSAAAQRRFVSYGELAEANGCQWGQVRYPMNTHLWTLVDYAHRRGWPMLSAMVVNKQHVATGAMDPSTLEGFAAAARELGHVIISPEEFLTDQQDRCFEWGASASA